MARLLAVSLGALLAAACSSGDDAPDGGGAPELDGDIGEQLVHWTAGAAPDFALRDVNPNSPTFDQRVTPRDHLGRISAWFFGWAT